MFGANSPGAHEESIMENEYASSLTERRLESIRQQSIVQRHCTQTQVQAKSGCSHLALAGLACAALWALKVVTTLVRARTWPAISGAARGPLVTAAVAARPKKARIPRRDVRSERRSALRSVQSSTARSSLVRRSTVRACIRSVHGRTTPCAGYAEKTAIFVLAIICSVVDRTAPHAGFAELVSLLKRTLLRLYGIPFCPTVRTVRPPATLPKKSASECTAFAFRHPGFTLFSLTQILQSGTKTAPVQRASASGHTERKKYISYYS